VKIKGEISLLVIAVLALIGLAIYGGFQFSLLPTEAVITPGQPTLFYEGFESASWQDGWIVVLENWVRVSSPVNAGLYSIRAGGSIGANVIQSQSFNLMQYSDPVLSGKYFIAALVDAGECIRIEAWNSVSWSQLGSYCGDSSPEGSWQSFSFDLTPYRSASSAIRFTFDPSATTTGEYIYLDEIKITGIVITTTTLLPITTIASTTIPAVSTIPATTTIPGQTIVSTTVDATTTTYDGGTTTVLTVSTTIDDATTSLPSITTTASTTLMPPAQNDPIEWFFSWVQSLFNDIINLFI